MRSRPRGAQSRPVRAVLFDLDHTLFDTARSERRALARVAREVRVPFSARTLALYQEVNSFVWAEYRAGRMTSEKLRVQRFHLWLERLRRTAHGFRAMALEHPKFFPYFAVHRLNTPAGVAYIDGVIGILRAAGFSDRDAATHFRTIGYYLTGAALDETSGYAKGPSAAEPVSNATIEADFSNLAAAAPFFRPGHFQATFEAGLEMLLAGIERAHPNIERDST